MLLHASGSSLGLGPFSYSPCVIAFPLRRRPIRKARRPPTPLPIFLAAFEDPWRSSKGANTAKCVTRGHIGALREKSRGASMTNHHSGYSFPLLPAVAFSHAQQCAISIRRLRQPS